MACGPPCGVAVGRMESSEKTITSPSRFSISVDVTAWKANPRRLLRHGAAPVPTTSSQARKPVRGGQRMAYRSKRRPARRAESKTGGSESISSAGDSDENRPKSVCTFDFGGQEIPQCLRAVRLRPDSIVSRMRLYAPYAVPLKGKRPKKVQLPKEVHKVHTALCMSSQPYSSLAFCSSRKSA